jgi:6-phosphogluconate dehydrogenase
MRLAVIGLGRMGANISRRLLRAGHEVVGFDRNEANVLELDADGLVGASSLEAAASNLSAPRIFWVMLAGGCADRGNGGCSTRARGAG